MAATKTASREEVLAVYAESGATAAAEIAGVSKRTVQRWAADEGVLSGYKPKITSPAPSVAAYKRGERDEESKAAYRDAQRKTKERRIERARKGVTEIPHGTVSGYSNWNCRCEECRAAWSAYLRERRKARKKKAVAAK